MRDPEIERGPSLYVSFETPGMADDLEWALQSGQADGRLVAEALLYAFYTPLYQMTQALGLNETEAALMLRSGFAAAVRQRYRFRSGLDIPRWFYSAALSALPRNVRHDAWPPLAVVLRAYTPFKSKSIAAFLNAPVHQVHTFLQHLDAQPGETLAEAGWEMEEGFAGALASDWRAAFRSRFPAPNIQPDELERLADEIAGQAERGSIVFRRALALRETLLILAAIAVMGLLALGANFILPAIENRSTPTPTPTPQHVVVIITRKVVQTRMVYITATPQPSDANPSTPVPYGGNPPMRINIRSNSGFIRERIRTTSLFWNTLWGDATLALKPETALGGPELNLRAQFWVSQNQLRLVIGPAAGEPQMTLIGNQDAWVWVDREGKTYSPEANVPNTFKPPIDSDVKLRLLPINLDLPFLPTFRPANLTPLRLETSLVRPAMLVRSTDFDSQAPIQVWLDRVTLAPLQIQVSGLQDDRRQTAVMQMNQALYDVSFTNQALFDTEQPQAALTWTNVSGEPVTATLSSTPGGIANAFIPAAAPVIESATTGRLNFIFSSPDNPFAANFPADLELGGKLLGSIPFGNPWTVVCARSARSNRLAYSSHPLVLTKDSRDASLTVYDLNHLDSETALKFPGFDATHLAFSPAGDLLAFAGAGDFGTGIYYVDLNADKPAPLFLAHAEQVDVLAWANDQSYLAWFFDQSDKFGSLSAIHLGEKEVFHHSWYWINGTGNELGLARPTVLPGIQACQ